MLDGFEQAREFLQKSGGEFEVIDYKLKKDRKKKPLGLFLLQDTHPRSEFNFCAHIHYSTSGAVECINLVHHRQGFASSVDMDEDTDGKIGKIPVYLPNEGLETMYALEMANKCAAYFHKINKRPWNWESDWKMKKSYKTLISRQLRARHFEESLISLDACTGIPKIY